ncbi:MAG TPA: GtrA family protein [Miltoncostaeaceae bacterium]|nr:GtrA family protein [Miltoncostaeaceae bacterium]
MPTREAPPAAVPGARVLRVPNIRAARRADWTQLLRFCVVGASGYLVNLVVFSLLVHAAGVHYIAAAVGAFVVAWTNNFVLNKFWTFQRHELPASKQAARYLAVSLVALGLNLIVLEVLVSAGSPEVPAQAIAIAVVMPVNFLLNRRWSFR